MELLIGICVGLAIGSGVAAVTYGILTMRRSTSSKIVDPGARQGPSQEDFDTLSGKVKKISLEWEDTHERLLRMARSARASARAAGSTVEAASDDGGLQPSASPGAVASAVNRAAVLSEWRRKNAARQ